MDTKNTNKKNQLIVNQYMTTEGKASGTFWDLLFAKMVRFDEQKKVQFQKNKYIFAKSLNLIIYES